MTIGGKNSPSDLEKIRHIPNCVAYFFVILSVGYHGGKLIFVLIQSTQSITQLHWRVQILILMILITFFSFSGRFLWTLFDCFGINLAQNALNKLLTQPADEVNWYLFLSSALIHYHYYFLISHIRLLLLYFLFLY